MSATRVEEMESELRELAKICPYCYCKSSHSADCLTRGMSKPLVAAMKRRRALIAACPGFNSGATDRSAPIFRELGLIDHEIICMAHAEGFTEIQAWKLFDAREYSAQKLEQHKADDLVSQEKT